MHRVDTATAVAVRPAVGGVGPNPNGFFTPGNPSAATPVPATAPGYDWFNMIQETLAYVVEQNGLTLEKGNDTQLYAAIAAQIAAPFAALTLGDLSNVTLTSPATGEALLWNGTAWVNGTPTSVLDQVRKTLLLNGLLDVVSEGGAVRLVNSFPDPLTDTSGIDTGDSSDYQHDVAAACIHNAGTTTVVSSSSSQWSDGVASFSWTGDDIAAIASGKSMRLAETFAGDFSVIFTIPSSEGYIGVYDASEDASFSATVGSSTNFDAMTKSWWIGPPVSAKNGVWYSTTEVVATSPAHGTEMRLERVGSTFYLYAGGSLYHTWSQTFAGAVRLMVSASATGSFQNVSWTIPGGATDMEIVSEERTALAAPSEARMILLVEPVDAVTYGTDLKLYGSNDNGATMDELTIEQIGTTTITVEGSPVEVDVIYAEGALTGTASTACRCGWSSFNTKEMRVYAFVDDYE